MGIDFVGLEAILLSLKYVTNKNELLTLGRQGLHLDMANINYLLTKYNFNDLIGTNTYHISEPLLRDLNFEHIDSLDNSSYEGADIIHNMNDPVPKSAKKYNYIFDGGTIEHIFNIAQVCENIIDLLEVGGIFCSVTTNNNFSGHGIYQFSPEFFLSAFSEKYGMKVLELYLAQVNSPYDMWINVNDFKKEEGGRNCSRFNTSNQVYIVAIIQKISDTRLSLLTNAPNQYSYETIDWKN
jgi:hypothetical protein